MCSKYDEHFSTFLLHQEAKTVFHKDVFHVRYLNFQENRLLEWCDAVENVEFVASDSIDREEIIENLQKVLPRECLFQPVSTLSGGMKRRVALVRAVIVDSDILVLDEPFTGLDEKAMRTAEEYILGERRGRAIVMASHQGEEKIFSDIAYRVLELRV